MNFTADRHDMQRDDRKAQAHNSRLPQVAV